MKLDKTAVEWIISKLPMVNDNDPYLAELIEQAEEIFKNQIQNAFYRGIQEQTQRVLFRYPEITEPEDYYKINKKSL